MRPLAVKLLDKVIAIGINDIKTQAMVLALTDIESGGFPEVIPCENLQYSAEGLLSTWPSRFTPDSAIEYEHQPAKIANYVYANRMGNGGVVSGDGYRYRGRGLIQLTGKTNYGLCSTALHLPLIEHPELLLQPENSVAACVWFLFTLLHNFEDCAKIGDVTGCTRRVNGGLIGLDTRKAKYQFYFKELQTERF